jgi:hypothetical protein
VARHAGPVRQNSPVRRPVAARRLKVERRQQALERQLVISRGPDGQTASSRRIRPQKPNAPSRPSQDYQPRGREGPLVPSQSAKTEPPNANPATCRRRPATCHQRAVGRWGEIAPRRPVSQRPELDPGGSAWTGVGRRAPKAPCRSNGGRRADSSAGRLSRDGSSYYLLQIQSEACREPSFGRPP